MRTTRAFVGAVGAGISLAVAASAALLVVSSVIAFRGWPDDLSGSREPAVARLSAARPPATRAGRTATVALPKAPRRTGAARGGDDRRGRVRARRTTTPSRAGSAVSRPASPVVSTGPTPPTGQVPSTGTTAEPSAEAVGQTTGAVRDAVRQTTGAVSDAVRQTTGAVSDAVAPVAPLAAGALESVGAAGADTVDRVGQAVDDALGTVLP